MTENFVKGGGRSLRGSASALEGCWQATTGIALSGLIGIICREDPCFSIRHRGWEVPAVGSWSVPAVSDFLTAAARNDRRLHRTIVILLVWLLFL